MRKILYEFNYDQSYTPIVFLLCVLLNTNSNFIAESHTSLLAVKLVLARTKIPQFTLYQAFKIKKIVFYR